MDEVITLLAQYVVYRFIIIWYVNAVCRSQWTHPLLSLAWYGLLSFTCFGSIFLIMSLEWTKYCCFLYLHTFGIENWVGWNLSLACRGHLCKVQGSFRSPLQYQSSLPLLCRFFAIFIHFTPLSSIFPQFSSLDLDIIFSAPNRSAPGKVNSDIGGAWPLAVSGETWWKSWGDSSIMSRAVNNISRMFSQYSEKALQGPSACWNHFRTMMLNRHLNSVSPPKIGMLVWKVNQQWTAWFALILKAASEWWSRSMGIFRIFRNYVYSST